MSEMSPRLPSEDSSIDISEAHNARVWNYWLGGKDNYDVDRQVGAAVADHFPGIVTLAREERSFLQRGVTHVTTAGIRQFLDIGTGLPTANNTHEVAQSLAPESRVLYVDNDPLVLVHARALLQGTSEGATDYVQADARDTDAILAQAAATLDLSRPVGVMLLGLLNFVPGLDNARSVVDALLDAVPAGSYLLVTHPTRDNAPPGHSEGIDEWNENAVPAIIPRNYDEISSLLQGVTLLEPGLVSCAQWRPDEADAAYVAQYGAVGYKR